MSDMLTRCKLLARMRNAHLALEFTKKFSENQLDQACERIEAYELQEQLNERQNLSIQEELIANPEFVSLYQRLCEEDVKPNTIAGMIEAAHRTHESLTDFPSERVLEAAKQDIPASLRFQYMKYFLPAITFEEDKKAIVGNLRRLTPSLDNIGELTESQRDMLRCPYVGEFLLTWGDHDGESLERLASNKALQRILSLLYENQIELDISKPQLLSLMWLSEREVDKFQRLLDILEYDAADVSSFMALWLENNAVQYDLDWFVAQLQPIHKERRQEILHSRLSYLNSLYSGRLHVDFEKTHLRNYQIEILIYAVQNRKKHFLDLVDQNSEIFLSLGQYSLIFEDGFCEHCNLNSLSGKDLKMCGAYTSGSAHFGLLEKGQEYTFTEMYLLWRASKQYVQLYTRLTSLPIDRRILTLEQLLKYDLMDMRLEEEQLEQLAQCLLQRPFVQWCEGTFGHIRGLTRKTAIRLLEKYNQVQRFVPDFQQETDAVFAVNNAGKLVEYSTWSQIRAEILTVDQDWQYLKKRMEFSDEFVSQYQNTITEFLLRGGAAAVRPLYDYFPESKAQNKEALRRITQAELMGQFYKLKYFTDDLRQELQYPISSEQETVWKGNSSIRCKTLVAEEVDDFDHTIRIGELPHHTCLSYLSGEYRECVLAAFDSNKKIILVRKGERIVARACLRLTKGSFEEPHRPEFIFADLTREDGVQEREETEQLTLFLERPYTSGLNEQETLEAQTLIVALAERKAAELKAMSVLSQSYSDAGMDRNYVSSYFYMFISKSKSGAQYLDSLGGESVRSNEATYKRMRFLVKGLNPNVPGSA